MTIELISGTMKSGKSERLIERILNYDNECLILKPSVDTRDGSKVKSRAIDIVYDAVMVDEDNEQLVNLILNGITEYSCIFIDEVQFFSQEFITMLIDISYVLEIDIVASGLRYDYMGNVFKSTELLRHQSNMYSYLKGDCDICGEESEHDVLVDTWLDNIIKTGDPVVVEGEVDRFEYKTVCNKCLNMMVKGLE